MPRCLELSTNREGVVLRQRTIHDDIAYAAAYGRNLPFINPGSNIDDTSFGSSHTTLMRMNGELEGMKLFGVWDQATLVGGADLLPQKPLPDGRTAAEIGYWTDNDQWSKGYATLAAGSLATYAAGLYNLVYARVRHGNTASQAVLKRCGFVWIAERQDYTAFAYPTILQAP